MLWLRFRDAPIAPSEGTKFLLLKMRIAHWISLASRKATQLVNPGPLRGLDSLCL